MTDLRDRCCWRGCAAAPDLIFYRVGLCDAHYAQACRVYKTTYDYLLKRVIPAAAAAMRDQHQENLTT